MSFLIREITKDDRQELESMAKEFQNANDEYLFEGINNFQNILDHSFEDFFKSLEKNKHISDTNPNWANQTSYVLTDEFGKIYGAANVRHELKGKLYEIGGNVGYAIRPSERKKGYATTLLDLLLNEFDKLGIENALVTCRENNIASKRTMNKFIGRSDTLVPSMHEGIMEYRYWIYVKDNLKTKEEFTSR